MIEGSVLPYILVSACICFLVRLTPFVIWKDEGSVPGVVRYVGKYLPPAIITGIVVYCLKGINFAVFPYGAKELSAVALVVILHLWKSNTLLSVFAGTAFYMVLVQGF